MIVSPMHLAYAKSGEQKIDYLRRGFFKCLGMLHDVLKLNDLPLLILAQASCTLYCSLCLAAGPLGLGTHMWNVTAAKFTKFFEVSAFRYSSSLGVWMLTRFEGWVHHRSVLWPSYIPHQARYSPTLEAHLPDQKTLRTLGAGARISPGSLLYHHYPRENIHLLACGKVLETPNPGEVFEYQCHFYQ